MIKVCKNCNKSFYFLNLREDYLIDEETLEIAANLTLNITTKQFSRKTFELTGKGIVNLRFSVHLEATGIIF